MANRLNKEKRAQIISCLVKGMSSQATAQITGTAKNTVSNMLADVGEACREYQDKAHRKLQSKRIQCDEIWSFCYAKHTNVPEMQSEFGNVYTWTALCADTKLVISWLVENQSSGAAYTFMEDLLSRLTNCVHMTIGEHQVDVDQNIFSADDCSMLVKIYGYDGEGRDRSARKLDQENCAAANLLLRKIDSLGSAVALHFLYYNFASIHEDLYVTPAMKAGISDHVWTLEDIAKLLN